MTGDRSVPYRSCNRSLQQAPATGSCHRICCQGMISYCGMDLLRYRTRSQPGSLWDRASWNNRNGNMIVTGPIAAESSHKISPGHRNILFSPSEPESRASQECVQSVSRSSWKRQKQLRDRDRTRSQQNQITRLRQNTETMCFLDQNQGPERPRNVSRAERF